MMSKFKFLIILIVNTLTFFNANAQNLKVFTKSESTNQYTLIQTTVCNDSLDMISKLRKIQTEDYKNGYPTAGFDSVVSCPDYICAYYNKGSKFLWKNFSIIDSNQLIINNNIKLKSPFVSENLYHKLDKTISQYAEIGYPFAFISVQRLLFENDSVTADFNVYPGEYYVFDSIIIKGDLRIKPHYLYKTAGFKKGDSFSFRKVNSMDKMLKAVPFISQARSYQLAFGEGKTDLLLYLTNKKSGSFSGLIGIMPNNKTTGKLLLTGDINLNLINAAGAGEFILFKWRKYEAQSQKLETEFSIPYLFKSDFGLGLDFDLEKKDTSYLNTDFTGKILYGNNTVSGFDLFYRNKSSYLLSTAENGNSGFRSDLYGIGLRFFDTDDWLNPSKGAILKISSAFGTRTTETDVEQRNIQFQTRNSLDFTAFIPLAKFFLLRLRSNTSSIYSKDISENETDRIGGLNSIRGFDELSLPATSYSIANIEFRYRFEEQSALFVFYDAAYFEKRKTVNDYYNYAMGIGAGLDLNTAAGIFSLAFAVGKQNNNPFLFNAAKIHFGYRNLF